MSIPATARSIRALTSPRRSRPNYVYNFVALVAHRDPAVLPHLADYPNAVGGAAPKRLFGLVRELHYRIWFLEETNY